MDDPTSKALLDPTLSPAEAVPVDVARSTSAPPPAAKIDPYVGKTIDGRYLVESVLGEGGMGVVYRGKHKVIDKKVAIKVLRGEMARDKEITERFLQEAKAASSIGNAHIIDISDFGTLPDGSAYFVMEFLAGKSLTEVIAEARPMAVPRLLHLAKQIATGLGAAHEAGIIHRDLKPDNVMLIKRGADKDFAKILDFGIAKVGGEASRLTRAGSVFGTPHYMSPEQAAGTSVDKRTDIYALGIILYEMASGKVPFDADNFMGILTQHMYKAPVPILALVPAPQIPPALDAIIQKCLTKKAEGRYASMGDLLLDLEKLETGGTPDALGEMMARSGGFNIPADYFRASAMPAPVPATPSERRERRVPMWIPAVVGATAVLLVLLGVIVNAKKGSAETKTVGIAAGGVLSPPTPSASASSGVAPVDSSSVDVLTSVEIVVNPDDAVVTRSGSSVDINTNHGFSFHVDLKPGEKVALLATRDGYKPSKPFVVDGSLDHVRLKLEPVAHAAKAKDAKDPKDGKPAKRKCPAGIVDDPACDPFAQ